MIHLVAEKLGIDFINSKNKYSNISRGSKNNLAGKIQVFVYLLMNYTPKFSDAFALFEKSGENCPGKSSTLGNNLRVVSQCTGVSLVYV